MPAATEKLYSQRTIAKSRFDASCYSCLVSFRWPFGFCRAATSIGQSLFISGYKLPYSFWDRSLS